MFNIDKNKYVIVINMKAESRNVHLINALKELKSIGIESENPEMMTKFIFELKMSNMLIPGIDDGEELIYETLISQDDDSTFLPLFSSEEEFYKHYSKESEYEPIENEFEIYAGIALDENIDGIILDVEGECFPITKEMIEVAQMDFSISFDDIETRSPQEIKEVYDNVCNDDLINFIRDESNENDFEGIMVELSNSFVLNLVVSDESLDEFAKEGIIEAGDVDGFSLCTMEDDQSGYGIIFTDKDAISKAIPKDDGLFYYAQLTKVSALFEFVLRSDMDGVIINPGSDEFVIPRSEILSQASGIELIVEDVSFTDCLNYAFLI